MGRQQIGDRKRRKDKTKEDEDMGFGNWGGYMAAKRAKLIDQFHGAEIEKISNIFEGIAIHVNGLTKPPMNELKDLMAAHGGLFHAYQVSSTTHIIASNLPNVKIKHLGSVPIVKSAWIIESISVGKLLDYRRYLLYTNQSKSQPRIDFRVIEKVPAENSHANITIEESTKNKECAILASTSENNIADQRSKASTKTASDPNFLEEFYNNSRLHLISTLGAEFKQLVGQMRDVSDGKFPGKDKLLAKKDKSFASFVPTSVIMHIDMDCFFVSVGLRNHPELRGKPLAITHARSGHIANMRPEQLNSREQEFALYCERLPEGVASRVDKIDCQSSMSEIASCSYEARKCGVKNGMFLGQAVKLCPGLKTLPYDFKGYKEVSHTLYETIASYTLDIEAVSCDEMYVDVTKILKESNLSVEEWAKHIREEIMEVTGCPCSTGFGGNRLQARLATRRAKPAGQYYLQSDDVESYMAEIPLADLPGVGRATLAKLRNLGLSTCGDVQAASLKILQSEIGQKAGETLKEQSKGIDSRPLNFHHERKSVSAEVNYGIRFKTLDECYNFLQSLSKEVHSRLTDINMRARCLTLKLLVRAADAPVETAKFLGHGVCDSLSKSTTSNVVIHDPQIIYREAKHLYDKLGPSFADLRGVGIQLSKLEKNAPVNTAMSKFLRQAPNKQSEKNCDNVRRNNVADAESRIAIPKRQVVQSKRGGRPRGGKNGTGNRQLDSKSLNRYFKESKGVEFNSKMQQQNTPINDQIDLDVLKELPEELRNEIIKEYQLENKVETKNIIHKKVTKETERKETIQKSSRNVSKKSPFSNLDWAEIKPVIRKWIQSADEPAQIDVEMIAEHFKQLAIDRKIENLLSIFNFLHRVFSELNCNWHRAYFSIVNISQEGMVARYGGTLMVKRNFECCQM